MLLVVVVVVDKMLFVVCACWASWVELSIWQLGMKNQTCETECDLTWSDTPAWHTGYFKKRNDAHEETFIVKTRSKRYCACVPSIMSTSPIRALSVAMFSRSYILGVHWEMNQRGSAVLFSAPSEDCHCFVPHWFLVGVPITLGLKWVVASKRKETTKWN